MGLFKRIFSFFIPVAPIFKLFTGESETVKVNYRDIQNSVYNNKKHREITCEVPRLCGKASRLYHITSGLCPEAKKCFACGKVILCGVTYKTDHEGRVFCLQCKSK